MAKIKHNNTLTPSMKSLLEQKEGYLYAEDQILNGRTLQIKGKNVSFWHDRVFGVFVRHPA
jgi:hypothetical protein